MQQTAKVGLRIAGGLVDLVVSAILTSLVGWITGLAATTAEGGRASMHVSGWPFLIIAAIVFGLFAVMESRTGKTPGKMMVGTHVVDEHGNRPELATAMIRNQARFIDGIGLYLVGLIIMLFSDENRRLGDMLAGTRVVTD